MLENKVKLVLKEFTKQPKNRFNVYQLNGFSLTKKYDGYILKDSEKNVVLDISKMFNNININSIDVPKIDSLIESFNMVNQNTSQKFKM